MLIGATCTGCAGSCPAADEAEAPEDAEAARRRGRQRTAKQEQNRC